MTPSIRLFLNICLILVLTSCTNVAELSPTHTPIPVPTTTQAIPQPPREVSPTPSGIPGTLIQAGSMNAARACHITVLLNNGKVLIAGGMERDGVYLDSAELFDPATGQFTPTGRLTIPRACPTATLLPDGKVLLAGGSTRQYHASAEIFDPITETFTSTGSMAIRRGGHTATLLPDGKVLITGGFDGSDYHVIAEIYDPANGTFTSLANMHEARSSHTATLLPDGKVLLTGGDTGDEILASAELYDPATGMFTPTGNMQQVRYKHAAVLLHDGTVLILGGSDSRDWQGQYASGEIYHPDTGMFTFTNPMNTARFKLTEAVVLLKDGKTFVAGGSEQVETYNPVTGTFDLADGGVDAPRFYMTAALLLDGRVLVTGGYDPEITASASAWLFTP
jgi:hypothetical protein